MRWPDHYELVDSYKTRPTVATKSVTHAPEGFPKGAETCVQEQPTHTGVYSSLIHGCQDLESTKDLEEGGDISQCGLPDSETAEDALKVEEDRGTLSAPDCGNRLT